MFLCQPRPLPRLLPKKVNVDYPPISLIPIPRTTNKLHDQLVGTWYCVWAILPRPISPAIGQKRSGHCVLSKCKDMNKITAILRRHFPWWRHQMETFSALRAFCAGKSPVTGEFPTQRPVTRSFDVFFDLRLNKRLRNNRDAGGLRRHFAQYDVTVMQMPFLVIQVPNFEYKLTEMCWIKQTLNKVYFWLTQQLKLVRVMSWCRQATSHNRKGCWPS